MNSNSTGDEQSAAAAVPEWLIKLESNREKLKKGGRLGHESGAGAPCNVCKENCPGLDLHFWRKLCRNCKCRKDEHACPDNDSYCWAQFDILGQTKSKPACVQIADKPVHVDWIPPNIDSELATDYMAQLGTTNIPVSGSSAALKRKQQLQFQVPIHDLDANFCDNLTENEAEQLVNYADELKTNCVGQGNVVRIPGGGADHGIYANVGGRPEACGIDNGAIIDTLFTNKNSGRGGSTVVVDTVLYNVINSELLGHVLLNSAELIANNFNVTKPMVPSTIDDTNLSKINKFKVNKMCLDPKSLYSGAAYGPVYDRILSALDQKHLDYANDSILNPISKLRNEYLTNELFKNDLNNYASNVAVVQQAASNDAIFNSPSRLKPIGGGGRHGQLMNQDTPIRRVKQQTERNIAQNPIVDHTANDKLISFILNSNEIQNVRHKPAAMLFKSKLCIVNNPMECDFDLASGLSDASQRKIEQIGLNQMAVQSAVVSGLIYDKLFQDLDNKNVNYADCCLLAPIKDFRTEYLNNKSFHDDINKYLTDSKKLLTAGVIPSKSNDSGFDSNPPTPNYATHPTFDGITNDNLESLPFEDLSIDPPAMQFDESEIEERQPPPVAILKCKSCAQDIYAGTVAVKAERAGKKVAWHPQCFKCNSCGELLADLVYFYHSDHIYCGRDLAMILEIPRCNACDELIFTKNYTAAEDKTFHIKHFCCFHCDMPLAGQQYVPDNESKMPVCLMCYDKFYAKTCQICATMIKPTEQGVSLNDIHWHSQCFNCKGYECGKSLINGRFCIKNALPFCSAKCVASLNLN